MKFQGPHLIRAPLVLLFLALFLSGIEAMMRKKRCRYSRIRGPCDSATSTQMVTFTLTEGRDNRCRAKRVKLRPCDPLVHTAVSVCKYFRKGQSGPCDIKTGTRSVVVNLKSGDSTCAPVKTLSKSCRKRKAGCQYFRQGTKGPCDSKTKTQPILVKLKDGSPSCVPIKTIYKPCKRRGKRRKKIRRKRQRKCRYNRRVARWSECDGLTNKKTKVMRLSTPNPHCPSTKIKTRKCRRNRKKANDCIYIKQEWSPCDESTNTRQREKVLTSGDPTVCLPKKVVTKKCKKECRYSKGNWTECDPETNLKNQTLTPVPGSPPQCQSSIHSKLCSPRAELTAAKPHNCKYLFSDWSSCDSRSNTMTQIMNLKNGDPNVCQRTVKLTRKCRQPCKFSRGEWSECDKQTGLTTRIDKLVKGRPKNCDATRQITKKCRKRACKYILGDWSECDPETNNRSRIKKLFKGNLKECKKEEIISKSCVRRDGEARCFFGTFGDFGPCTNGVMTKHRPVLQGGVECERKAVIIKAC